MIEVKKIYMDLQEATQINRHGNTVWALESDTYKEPITIQIEYSDRDREDMKANHQEAERILREAKENSEELKRKEETIKELKKDMEKYVEEANHELEKRSKENDKKEKEKAKVLQETKKLQEQLEKQNEQVKALQDRIAELEKKASKQPRVYSGQTFVSGNGPTGLTALKVPDGDYIMSEVVRIVEKNEYVKNEDLEVHAYNLHVTDGLFIPEYELIGTTQLDTPTATVNRTFTLLPY